MAASAYGVLLVFMLFLVFSAFTVGIVQFLKPQRNLKFSTRQLMDCMFAKLMLEALCKINLKL